MAKAKQDFVKIQNIPDHSYNDYVDEKKNEILSYHLQHNPFYKNFTSGIDIHNWNDVPVLTKSDFQIPLHQRLSEGFTTKNCHIHKTSGSSGTPLIFAKDKYAHALTWANFIDRYSWYGINAASSKQARFYGIPLHGFAHYKERFKDILGNRFRFSVFDLSPKKLDENLHVFSKTAFEYINGYTSAIVQFAKYLNRQGIVLKDICPSLTVCIVTAEMLFEADKALLEACLGIPVVNEYGSAELGLIAFNDHSERWLVNSEDLFIEILDDNNMPLPLETIGRVVVTSLYNKAHPFIRYELGDVGMLERNSTCKYPVLKYLEGRTSDIVKLPSGKTAAGLTFYYVTKTVIEDDANVTEFIIEQTKLDTFKILYNSKNTLSKEKIEAISTAVKQYLEPGLKLNFERKDKIKRSKSGKLKQFTSLID